MIDYRYNFPEHENNKATLQLVLAAVHMKKESSLSQENVVGIFLCLKGKYNIVSKNS